MESITFGICTYNRRQILMNSAKSLALVRGIEKVHIRIYDDCSNEYDEAFLRSLFPDAVSITRQKVNLGADKNTSLMYEDFLKSGDEWLFNADSDLIYRADLLEAMESLKEECGGFMTFFNCISHGDVREAGRFVEKDSVGAAGCFFRRDVIQLILEKMKVRSVSFDVGFSKVLRRNGYPLYACRNSMVQHIGVTGFNSANIIFDYGRGFVPDSQVNAQIVEDTFEAYVASVREFSRRRSFWAYNFITSTIPRKIDRYGRVLRELNENRKGSGKG